MMTVLIFLLLFAASGSAQDTVSTSSAANSSEITFHSSSHLVLVDVIALGAKNGLPDESLKRDDFTVFDDDRPVSIKTFDDRAQFTTRSLALWFVVQCNMQHWEKQGSGLFAGRIYLLKPALRDLDKQDRVGVAHWCDNGDAQLDLLPTGNVNEATATLEQVLAPMPAFPTNRQGELALQRTLQQIVEATRSAKPQPLPVVIFLYGDHSGMPREEADHFIGELLQTSAVAFGLKDRRSPPIWLIGEQAAVAKYIATQTGGQYLRVTPETYAKGLEEILRQLHGRYELGFQPAALDGKRHKLRVELADAARSQHKGVRLRYRTGYVPVPSATE